MTPTPDFNDLTPPDELVEQWNWERRDDGLIENTPIQVFAANAARWGARHGWDQARQLWPEPITDRPPTEEDGDDQGRVQIITPNRRWDTLRWDEAARYPWAHSPRWQPRQPSLQEQALALLEPEGTPARVLNEEEISLIRRALEQAGEGQA